ncbi:MAG: UMP kinase [Saccharofermentanales bacterium]|jgi:uridylate kinase
MGYRRILLKLSGQSLAGGSSFGLDGDTLDRHADVIGGLVEDGHEVGVVIGGGNFWRGRSSGAMDRVAADQIGMLATVMNSLALADALDRRGIPQRLMTAVPMPTVGEAMNGRVARRYLEEGAVVIFGGGTGNPFFSTDSAAALRAAEIGADAILMTTLVDGVYDRNPDEHPDAKLLKELTFDDVLTHQLGVMDATAAALCRDFGLTLVVFNADDLDNIRRAAEGDAIGSVVRGR